MRGSSHYLIALGSGLGAAAAIASTAGLPDSVALLLGCLAGARSPDHLEGELLGMRLIPHRTITHWLPLWLLLAGFSAWLAVRFSLPGYVVLGYALGGLLHVIADLLTPMGVPILTPVRRHSLRLVRGAGGELMVVGLALAVGLLAWVPAAHAGPTVGSPASNALLDAQLLGAQAAKRCDSPGECGWWWGFDSPVRAKPKPTPPAVPSAAQAQTAQEEACHHAKSWSLGCGFVNPHGSFALQAKERDALREAAVMNPGDQNAVYQFQKYMRWMTNEAILFTQMWTYNMQQFPSLNPSVTAPLSAFGLRMASEAQHTHNNVVWHVLHKMHAFFVYFSRSDCTYCHAMAPTVQRVARHTGLPIWDASLDGECLPGFKHCGTAPETIAPAERLRVRIVPTLFIYVPTTKSWLRVSTGISSETTIESRTRQFFEAAETAAKAGLEKSVGGTTPVDFKRQTISGAEVMKLAQEKGLADGVQSGGAGQ
ncbi:hypothetical protein BJI67_16115 (plasmid) [Acidihalobacter aeolianus]|uniref:Metal-dependent hydrolase n=1 Tax=Acidihalobacter aeolianus TaxID=2792603 RepID=A0A1D8KCV7_9GAMM|nr:conjugal transfer protein TraF [Acidihalobacter aeolianus]AOV18764.1 hypothetical protein BJI67_16115 [Acidihalobacter aeolianus]